MGGVHQTEFHIPTDSVHDFIAALQRDGCCAAPSFDAVAADGVLDITRPEMADTKFMLGFWPPESNATTRRADLHWWPLRIGDDKQFGTCLALRVRELAVQHGATIPWESPYK